MTEQCYSWRATIAYLISSLLSEVGIMLLSISQSRKEMLREVKEPASGHTANKEQSTDSDPSSQAELSDGIERAEPFGACEASGGNSSAWSPGIGFRKACLYFGEKLRSSGIRQAHAGIPALEPITLMALCRPHPLSAPQFLVP